MRKILLFGKLNEITKDVNLYLQPYFQLQLCSENMEIAMGMLKIFKPEAVIISLVGLYEIHSSLFTELHAHYRNIPVIVIGTKQESNSFEAVCKGEQFIQVKRPVDNAEIMRILCEKLELDMERLIHEKEENDKKHVICVDDNPAFLRVMQRMLTQRYSVSLATSATQAMTIMGRRKPDLIILDYDMPICDGKMMLEMIRADQNLKYVPVIFLTGISDKEHIMAVLELKPAGYFLKPPAYDKLMECVQELLDQ